MIQFCFPGPLKETWKIWRYVMIILIFYWWEWPVLSQCFTSWKGFCATESSVEFRFQVDWMSLLYSDVRYWCWAVCLKQKPVNLDCSSCGDWNKPLLLWEVSSDLSLSETSGQTEFVNVMLHWPFLTALRFCLPSYPWQTKIAAVSVSLM